MELKISSYRAIARKLDSLTAVMERLAEDFEAYMKAAGVEPPLRQKLSAEDREVEISYVDDEAQVVREIKKQMGRADEDEDV
jgi:uncharacterized membrane protein